MASHVSDLLLIHMDNMQKDILSLERRLDRERKRTQKHYYEANQNMHNYHRYSTIRKSVCNKVNSVRKIQFRLQARLLLKAE